MPLHLGAEAPKCWGRQPNLHHHTHLLHPPLSSCCRHLPVGLEAEGDEGAGQLPHLPGPLCAGLQPRPSSSSELQDYLHKYANMQLSELNTSSVVCWHGKWVVGMPAPLASWPAVLEPGTVSPSCLVVLFQRKWFASLFFSVGAAN